MIAGFYGDEDDLIERRETDNTGGEQGPWVRAMPSYVGQRKGIHKGLTLAGIMGLLEQCLSNLHLWWNSLRAGSDTEFCDVACESGITSSAFPDVSPGPCSENHGLQ